jgi:hypothetical protein
MKSCRTIAVFASVALCVVLLSGCFVPLPDSYSEISAVYPRVDQNNITNEVIIVVHSGSAWMALGPDGGQVLGKGYNDKTRYYFSDRHVRRRSLQFLESTNTGFWETFLPVQGTNCWVRVQGTSDYVSRDTNTVIITTFTPRKLLHQRSIQTVDFHTINYVHFSDGNRIIAYKSENNESVYNVLEDSLSEKSPK